jgi:hypothetical protein
MINIRCSCDYVEERCPKCKGQGGINGNPCRYCLGYGIVGWATAKVLDRRRRVKRRRYPLDPIFANPYWKFFNTQQKLPVMAKLLAGIDTEEVGYVD